MKKAIILKRIAACVLAAALMTSVISCSSDSDNDSDEEETTTTTTEAVSEETTTSEETSEETTTTEETTEASTEETSEETSEETTEAYIDDPQVNIYNDPEVRSWASWYINNGYEIEYMSHDDGESWWGEGTNMVEGFAAAEPGDNLFTIDYVMKFPDYETADAFLNELDGSDFGDVVRTENGDGSCTFEVDGGLWSGSLSANNVIVFVCNEELA